MRMSTGLPLAIAAVGGVAVLASLALGSEHHNPTSERFVTWLGDAKGQHGSWIYTWSDTPVPMDVIRHARQRGFEAGRHGQIGENPVDFQTDRSSPDLRLVNVWYAGYQQGQVQSREDRRKPTFRLRPARETVRNPWTPPGAHWPVYEYKIEPDKRARSLADVRRWTVKAFVRNSTPANDPLFVMRPHSVPASATYFTAHEFSFGSYDEAFGWAKGHAQYVASRQVRSPNPVRVLDQRGVCVYSVKYAPKIVPTSRGSKAADYWSEIPCT